MEFEIGCIGLEPAQRDGQNVSAEFIFVYRFRLQR